MKLSVISYGGGVQSTAMMVLAAQGELDVDAVLFANVGDDSERQATLHYVRDVAVPFAQQHGIALHELHRVRRDGSTETLYGRLTKPGQRSIDIPVRVGEDGAPGNRRCTADFKLKVVARWLREHGATADNPATVHVGISLDEIHRANNRRAEPNHHVEYPLLDRKLRRTDCIRLIRNAGLPVPPKSACWFCPMRKSSEWQTMRIEDPAGFEQACQLEETLLARRAEIGRDPAYLSRLGGPLRDVIPADAMFLPLADDSDGTCDSGWCMT